ncbi:HAMP domain-containing sensor histidine kinase [Desulfovibrionales bacterium]
MASSHTRLRRRILRKIHSESARALSRAQRLALRIFLDLSLENESLSDFHSLCVLVPELCLNARTSLYLRNSENQLVLRRTTNGMDIKHVALPEDVHNCASYCYADDKICIFPIIDINASEHAVAGQFCVHQTLTAQEQNFYINFCNKISRILLLKQTVLTNKQRIAFINTLMRDIGHNIIVPNMHFKLLFLRMEKTLAALNTKINRLPTDLADPEDTVLRHMLPPLVADIRDQLHGIMSRFQQTSLFLESLVRRSHFEKGQYDLALRPCKFKSQIIEPQLNRFRTFLQEQGITAQIAPDVHIDHDIVLDADVGLMSQVFANLFSNAVKYTQAVAKAEGEWRKELVYGWELQANAFGPKSPGVCIYIATSGPPVGSHDAPHLFEANFRAASNASVEGSGNGLYFVKQIVELHGGQVRYHAAEHMNFFSLILPCHDHIPSFEEHAS